MKEVQLKQEETVSKKKARTLELLESLEENPQALNKVDDPSDYVYRKERADLSCCSRNSQNRILPRNNLYLPHPFPSPRLLLPVALLLSLRKPINFRTDKDLSSKLSTHFSRFDDSFSTSITEYQPLWLSTISREQEITKLKSWNWRSEGKIFRAKSRKSKERLSGRRRR